ncbi:chloride channel protein [Mycolicibacterium sp.]|uniref:chloride channel protein n=1 Tax=Mycolicibacterium sp. TaxID=2320850 RepID=UPI0028AB0E77|nr:chloride channel protein [Mycolicibacterium sp.]
MGRLLALAVLLGVVASLAAAAFLDVVALGQEWLFERLPRALGLAGLPWWWVAMLLVVGAGIVLLARRMPGATGPGPLTGFHFDTRVADTPSLLLAAFGSLVCGFVLGPEAPLIVVGSVLGAVVMRGRGEQEVSAARLLGGAAAIGAVFGNPFITAFMMLEFCAMGMFPARMITPLLVALGSGYAMQVGVLGFAGVGTHSLTVPGLPAYDTIGIGHLGAGLLVAVVAGIIALIVRQVAVRADQWADRARNLAVVAAAAVTFAGFLVARAFDIGPSLVLFSGLTGMPDLIKESSVTAVIVILLVKAVLYMAALSGGMRGGPIFPATYLGVAVGVAAALTFPGIPATPLVAAGIGAAAAGITRMPATSAILGAILLGGSGAAVAPFAILGAVAGYLMREWMEGKQGDGVAPHPADSQVSASATDKSDE